MSVLIRVLGIPSVNGAKRPLTAMHARLLGLLICERGSTIPAEVLADRLWYGDPPKTSASALRLHLTKVRDALGDRSIIASEPGRGYSVRSDLITVDADVFAEGAARVYAYRVAHSPESAVDEADRALALWSGAPYSGCDDQLAVVAERARLDAIRRELVLDRLVCQLALGLTREVLPELRAMSAEQPGDEQVAELLMRTLSGMGATAEALRVFDDAERWLQQEFGAPPALALQQTAADIAQRSGLRPALRSLDGAPQRRAAGGASVA